MAEYIPGGVMAATRARCIRAIRELADTLNSIDGAQEDGARLREIAADLEEMFFLIVVIGEFNVGKSSLINALLGESLLQTGITPTTEAIELIRYSEEAQRRPEQSAAQPGVRRWAHPNTGGTGVALVDTPGSGSVFRQHEERARSFLHRSDLVLFVLSAKRALAETERLYLELARDYGKKVILVLNQSDLLAPAELEQVRRFITGQVQELLDIRPLLFAVSATRALAGEKDDGLAALRTHLSAMLNEIPPARRKQLAQLETATRALRDALAANQKRRELLRADESQAELVGRELQASADGLEENLERTLADLAAAVAALERLGLAFLEQQLAFRPLRRVPSGAALQERFEQEVLGPSLGKIRELAEGYIHRLVDHNRAYWQQLHGRLQELMDLLDQSAGPDAALFAEQREDLQQAIRHAEREEGHYGSGALIAELQAQFAQNLVRFRYSALVGLGGWLSLVLAILTPGPLVGVAAAPLALPAAVVGAPLAVAGSFYALRQMRRIRRESQRELREASAALARAYQEALTRLTRQERQRLLQNGDELLRPLLARLKSLAEHYEEQAAQLADHERELAAIRVELTADQ